MDCGDLVQFGSCEQAVSVPAEQGYVLGPNGDTHDFATRIDAEAFGFLDGGDWAVSFSEDAAEESAGASISERQKEPAKRPAGFLIEQKYESGLPFRGAGFHKEIIWQ